MNKSRSSRRNFIYQAGITSLGLPLLGSSGLFSSLNTSAQFNKMPQKKLGVALVGLGNYATGQLAPALQQTSNCYLAGIVTGTPAKIPVWQEKYKIPDANVYNYENFDEIARNPAIDVIYVVLPNSMHAEYTIRAFEAGKHVICEKPMAISVEECDVMIAAAGKAGKTLSIGYRLQFDPYHLEMTRLAQEKIYGNPETVETSFAFTPNKGEWRLNKKYAGGGPLMDLGIYCLQAVCYLSAEKPKSVTAKKFPVSDPEKFLDIEETISWQMEMPGNLLGNCRCSYAEHGGMLQVNASDGWFKLQPSFNYGGLKFSASDDRSFERPVFSQQALQLDAISTSILKNQASKVSGEMGRRDMKIVEAIYESMNTGKKVNFSW